MAINNNSNLPTAERLRLFAKEKFNTIAELERAMGKNKGYLLSYLNGRSMLGGETLKQLSELGCDINWLLTGKNSVSASSETQNVKELLNEVIKYKSNQ